MIEFLLNETSISTGLLPGTLLLDFIRYHKNLTGTKIGCREGDCGACTVLVGEIKNGELIYQSATSCLMAIGNAQGKHIVTIEGINIDGLNFIQQAFAEEGATQCGFCTPGFIVSLTGFCLNADKPTCKKGIDAVNGNICRCTGYKSIERAIEKVAAKLQQRDIEDAIDYGVSERILPEYFKHIKEKLVSLKLNGNGQFNKSDNAKKYLSGGTDLYVQQHDTMPEEEIEFLFDKEHLNGITQVDNTCFIGASATSSDIAQSLVFKKYFSGLDRYIKLVSSTQIRNMATIAGNFVNASPIGDLTIFFLALDAVLVLNSDSGKREVALKDFYKGYKSLDKLPGEYIEKIYFELPAPSARFNFEKISKRTHLDIASVNTSICIDMDNDKIKKALLAAGGVGPVPLFLKRTSGYLQGKVIGQLIIEEAIEIAQQEISPISDARGTETYKRFLLSQLIRSHFITLFPYLPVKELINV